MGAGLCFIGHGAFGFITKAAWVPYFGVVGIPEAWAWQMMPLVGALDITIGMSVLFAPRPIPIAYMAVWGLWTAMLRPLSGEPFFEALERAGNYGVPFALLLLTTTRSVDRTALVKRVLQVSTVLLLAGHGALGAITGKPIFETQYASVGLPVGLTAAVGWFEIGLAAAILVRPAVALLLFACAWKLGTESLWITSGAPVWEFVERAGSYAAPLALAMMTLRGSVTAPEPPREQPHGLRPEPS